MKYTFKEQNETARKKSDLKRSLFIYNNNPNIYRNVSAYQRLVDFHPFHTSVDSI